ncbi:hypothetical protein F4825DRAFT_271406 [Nemania diffusa]|nr:hypothetical protein F4825DRAFT_271406 [Nemania diffusa]
MRYLTVGASPLAACAFGILSLVGASTVLTFTDQNCTESLKTITTQDTSISGECTRLTSGFGSFMVGTLGDGCAVTIYGKDTDDLICSATSLEIAEASVCYNSTWVYFSVDNCVIPDTSSSASTSTLASATSATSITSTALTASIVSTTSTISPEPTAGPTSNGVNVGAVVGGTISGVFVVAALTGVAVYFFWFQPRHQRQLAELSARPDTPDARLNSSSQDNSFAKADSYVKSDSQTELHELSPQYIAEVHEETHVRYELPP